MLKKDSLGKEKVRKTPEYTAKTHWASITKFGRIYSAPFLFVLLPLVVILSFKAHTALAEWISELLNKDVNEYVVLAAMAVLLWQVIVCWCVWHPLVCKFKKTPLHTYNLYGDIVEYSSAPTKSNDKLPKFYKRLRTLINIVPVILVTAAIILCCVKGYEHFQNNGESTDDTQVEDSTDISVPEKGTSTVIAVVVGFALGVVCGLAFSGATKKAEEKQPKKKKGKKLSKKEKAEEKEKNKERVIKARSIIALLGAEKRFPEPKVVVPETTPNFIKKYIFRHAIRYNYGDVIVASPMGPSDDLVFSCVEEPNKLVDYLNGVKKNPSEVASYNISR